MEDFINMAKIITLSFQNKYKIMDEYYTEDIKGGQSIGYSNILVFNLEPLLSSYKYSNKIFIEKYKNDKEYKDRVQLCLSIDIINFLGFYKNYFNKKSNGKCKMLVFLSSYEYNKQFSNLIFKLSKILDNIEDVVFVRSPDITNQLKEEYNNSSDSNISEIHLNHIMTGLIKDFISENKENSVGVHIFGSQNNKKLYSYLDISKKHSFINRVNSKFIMTDKYDLWDKIVLKNSKVINQIPEKKVFMDLITPCYGALTGFNRDMMALNIFVDKKNINKLHKDRISKIFDFINVAKIPLSIEDFKIFDKQFILSFTNEINIVKEYLQRVKNLRIEYHNLYKLSVNLIKETKIKLMEKTDNKLNELNDIIKSIFNGEKNGINFYMFKKRN